MASSSSQRVSRFIPEEIITAIILPKLPVKDLCRFKCVSKPWRSLISSQRFVKAHLLAYSHKFPRIVLNIGEENYRLIHLSLNSLLNDSNSEEEAIDYPLKGIDQGISVIGSYNGLLCLAIYLDNCLPEFYLLNPSTRLDKKLPPVNGEMKNWNSWSYQFVYTAVDDDYKFFCFYTKSGVWQANVYSWRANSWITRVSIKASVMLCCDEKFVAGKIYFGTRDPGLVLHGDEADNPTLFDIVSFDLERGVCETIEQPDYGGGVKRLFLDELGGWFCVVCKKETHVDWWVMKEYGVKESWTKMLTVSFVDNPRKMDIEPVTILPSGKILMVWGSTFEVYNPKDKSLRVLNTPNFGSFSAEFHVESLVSPTHQEDERRIN